MVIVQFFLIFAIFTLGWVSGILITEEFEQFKIKKKKKKKKPLTMKTYGDESPEEVFRMTEEAKKINK
jgi:Na+/glutamate symporter